MADNDSFNLANLEFETIMDAMEYFDWNRTHAAHALGIAYRTLTYKLEHYQELGIVIKPRVR